MGLRFKRLWLYVQQLIVMFQSKQDYEKECKEELTEEKECPPLCPPKGWGGWENWSNCPVTCGTAQRARRRHCLDDAKDELKGKSTCRGINRQSEKCDMGKCGDKMKWVYEGGSKVDPIRNYEKESQKTDYTNKPESVEVTKKIYTESYEMTSPKNQEPSIEQSEEKGYSKSTEPPPSYTEKKLSIENTESPSAESNISTPDESQEVSEEKESVGYEGNSPPPAEKTYSEENPETHSKGGKSVISKEEEEEPSEPNPSYTEKKQSEEKGYSKSTEPSLSYTEKKPSVESMESSTVESYNVTPVESQEVSEENESVRYGGISPPTAKKTYSEENPKTYSKGGKSVISSEEEKGRPQYEEAETTKRNNISEEESM